MAQKKSTKRKTTRKSKKPKVYIPAYKIIILCAMVITVCMSLLLVTTIKSPEKPVITERFEEEKPEVQETKPEIKPQEKKSEEKKSPEKKADKKPEPAKTQEKKTPEKKPVETKPAETKPVEKKTEEKKPAVEQKPVQKPASVTEQPKAEEKKPEVKTDIYNFPQAKNGAQLVFLLDDGGQNLNHLKPFLNLPFPVTIAVLPRLTHSVESARLIRASGKHELMLHQPMQAINNKVNPGPGAITPEMTESQIRTTLFNNINEIGPIAGLNNHEGSAITADAEKMAVIMNVATENGIFFLDSRTNKDTTVPYVAGEMGYSYYERNGYFLDNEKTKENALKELRRNLNIANKTGSVIMIGHIWSADFLPEFLTEVYPELKARGYTFTTVSKSKGIKNSH